jgi:hypothetical protein
MRIDITEVAAFAQLLAPAVVGATLRLTADDINDYPDFPVAALYYEDPQDLPTGILVDPPNTGLVYTKPLSKLGDCRAEIYKAEEHLATLTGVQYPSTIGW